MMPLASYERRDNVGVITLDDGKVNVMSPVMQSEIHAALDQAEHDSVALISGRPGVLSAGFDLQVLASGGAAAADMVIGGFELSYRLLSFPRPIVIACTGHAIAMGAFLLLSGDYRIGTSNPTKYTANEVAIGLTMPRAALEVLRQRLSPSAFLRAALLSEVFSPSDAIEAGFLDEVVGPDDLLSAAIGAANRFAALNAAAFSATKLRARATTLAALRSAIDADIKELQRQ